jgi:hypothetical protein
MYPCAITWCVAMTEKTFCPMHEKDQSLHPHEFNESNLEGYDIDDEDAEDD